jgi:OmpA-OmpF porin, OOP family
MSRTLFSLSVVLLLPFWVGAIATDTLITVTGKVLDSRDSTGISTSILYEKLPYYDDMGLASSSGSGEFTFYLIKGKKYVISIRKAGFKALNQEVTVGADGKLTALVYFFLESDDIEEVFELKNVIFARGSEKLTEDSFVELDRLIERLKANPTMLIQLEGHTDFAGNPEANMALSQARVDEVKAYLVKKGINKNRVLTKAYGGTRPLYYERTPEAMGANRRVEVRILRK